MKNNSLYSITPYRLAPDTWGFDDKPNGILAEPLQGLTIIAFMEKRYYKIQHMSKFRARSGCGMPYADAAGRWTNLESEVWRMTSATAQKELTRLQRINPRLAFYVRDFNDSY